MEKKPNAAREWEKNNPERSKEIQRKSSQMYYYKNREKVLAKKQLKYAEARGMVIIPVQPEAPPPPEPEPEPIPPPEPIPEPVKILDPPKPKLSHPLFR